MAHAETHNLEMVGKQLIVLEDVSPDDLTQFLDAYGSVQQFDSVEFVLSGDDARLALNQDCVAGLPANQTEIAESDSGDNYTVTGQAAEVLREIHERGGWIRSKELKSSNGLDIAKTSMTSILWQLSDAGYLEKRDYAEDTRQNEYQITDLAQEVI